MIEITFLRHGRSLADDEQVHEGRYDSPLTDIGEYQAQLRSQQWCNENRQFELIITSPLIRARKCAEIMAEKFGVDIQINENWIERDNGSLAGMKFTESASVYPKSNFVNPYQPYVVSANNGESSTELYCRASMALQEVIRKGSGKYLVISHGAFLNAALNVIMGNQPRANESGVVFAFSDLGYADLAYNPKNDTWLFKGLVA